MPLPAFPAPPASIFEERSPAFVVASGMGAFVRGVLLDEEADLYNEDHAHLAFATIGFLWATGHVASQGRTIIGQAEIFQPRGKGYVKTRQEAQVCAWFGDVPDFIVTLSAEHVAEALAQNDPVSPMALLEHELYHCGQAIDEFGAPRFIQAGPRKGHPVFTIKGHDVEEHTGVVRRYGAYSTQLREMVAAANRTPIVGRAQLDGICGTCLRRAA